MFPLKKGLQGSLVFKKDEEGKENSNGENTTDAILFFCFGSFFFQEEAGI